MVRLGILSDIHANLPALEAVLEDAKNWGVDMLVSLGDNVGYNFHHNECLDLIRKNNIFSVEGNHEFYLKHLILDFEYEEEFGERFYNDDSIRVYNALIDAKESLSSENRDFVCSLPSRRSVESMLFVHGHPINDISEAQRFRYVDKKSGNIGGIFNDFGERLCFVGHTHRGGVIFPGSEYYTRFNYLSNDGIKLNGGRAIVNVGSVGVERASFGSFKRELRAKGVEFTQEQIDILVCNSAKYVVYDSVDDIVIPRAIKYDYMQVKKEKGEVKIPSHRSLRVLSV